MMKKLDQYKIEINWDEQVGSWYSFMTLTKHTGQPDSKILTGVGHTLEGAVHDLLIGFTQAFFTQNNIDAEKEDGYDEARRRTMEAIDQYRS